MHVKRITEIWMAHDKEVNVNMERMRRRELMDQRQLPSGPSLGPEQDSSSPQQQDGKARSHWNPVSIALSRAQQGHNNSGQCQRARWSQEEGQKGIEGIVWCREHMFAACLWMLATARKGRG